MSDWFKLDASAENDWEGVAKILKDTKYTYLEEKGLGVDLVVVLLNIRCLKD